MDWMAILKDLGLLGLVGLILYWMFTEQSRLNKQVEEERKLWMNQSNTERMKWQEIINNFNNCQAQLMTEHRDFRLQVGEAHKYQREEHLHMIDQLKEITLTLGRINGYTDKH
jgi:hypothetical protein